jgi:plasmid segregation protein ParM
MLLARQSKKVVRAVEVGFTNNKFIVSASVNEGGKVRLPTASFFPSVVTTPPARNISASLGARRDTFRTEVNGVIYEVGPDARLALAGNASGQDMNTGWILSDHYTALVHGALHYMNAPDQIDLLVLSLPVSVYKDENCEKLSARFAGADHMIGEGDEKRSIHVDKVLVLPQPYGGFAWMIHNNEDLYEELAQPDSIALVIDPGYNTVDWLMVQGGSSILDGRTNAAENAGMVRVLSAMADAISRDTGTDIGPLYRLDEAIRDGRGLPIRGQRYEITEELKSLGKQAAYESIQRMLRGVGSINDITHVFLVGGAAPWFYEAVCDIFAGYKIVTAKQTESELNAMESLLANALGLQLIGEMRLAD